jgi:hypothetical protein
MADAPAIDAQVIHWRDELERAKKRFRTFWDAGDGVVDAYRMQKADGNDANHKDKYNILYSSTETIRPNLYAQQPKTRVTLRNKDAATNAMRAGALLLEGSIEYIKDEEDFDELMDSAVEDYLLPGLGVAWVRYEAKFGDKLDENGQKVPSGKPNEYVQELLDEMVKMEYVYWQDFLTGVSRTWKETPWVAKRLWMTKEAATSRFGQEKADKLTYTQREAQGRDMDNPSETAEAWEIWDKLTKTVYWYGEGVPELLDKREDPLKLKAFFPCPRPLRAISNTRTFVPRALYSQYKSQAETLNILTKRIRLLGEALRVVGLYDGSQVKLADILNPSAGNRMVAVDNWALFAQNGGINGAVVWVPIDQIVKVLGELLKSREVCKAEIYEITGFSDIVRGVSKASETLGAQNLKADWASARVKKMQKDVQRFARDLLAMAGELIAEHCAPETIAIFSGLQIPTAEEVRSNPEAQQRVQLFTEATKLIKNELRRVSSIDIETDSTLMADDQQDKQDRAQFLAAAGAFLQQAVPAMEATPELGPLLGAMLMFTVRSFPSARVVEDEFEKVQQAMANRPAPDRDKDGKKAKTALDTQKLQQDGELKNKELEVRQAHEQASTQNQSVAEANRHQEKMAELALRDREMAVRERELAMAERKLELDEQDADTRKFTAISTAAINAETLGADVHAAEQQQELEYDQMDRDDAHKDADRAVAKAAAEAQEPPEGGGEGEGT